MFYCDDEAKRYKICKKIWEIFQIVSLISSEGHVLSGITQTSPKVRNLWQYAFWVSTVYIDTSLLRLNLCRYTHLY